MFYDFRSFLEKLLLQKKMMIINYVHPEMINASLPFEAQDETYNRRH